MANSPPSLEALNARYFSQLGNLIFDLAPNGSLSTERGNLVYGAATDGFGFPLWFSQSAAQIFEAAEQLGLKGNNNNDQFIFDSPAAQRDIELGSKCPG